MTVAARTLRLGRGARRADMQLRDRHMVDLTAESSDATSAPISLPITRGEVEIIASSGFPLWEPIATLQLRNHRITLAYGDLSHQLSQLIAGSDDEGAWDANWCTFATWSSRTIGTCIDRQPEHGLIHHLLRHVPQPLRRLFYGCAEALLCRGHGAIYRTLAIGNRLVFLEIGTAISHFLQCFDPAHEGTRDPDFEAYWSDVHAFLVGLRHLDPSWLATAAPDPTTLRAGMHAYFDAINETNPKAKAELVLLGNLLLGAYEQTRVEGYLTATLSFFTTSWLHRLMRGPKPGVVASLGRGLGRPFFHRLRMVLHEVLPGSRAALPGWDDRAHGRKANSLIGWLAATPRIPRSPPAHPQPHVAGGPDVLRPLRSTVRTHSIPQLGQLRGPYELHHQSLPFTPAGSFPLSVSLDAASRSFPAGGRTPC